MRSSLLSAAKPHLTYTEDEDFFQWLRIADIHLSDKPEEMKSLHLLQALPNRMLIRALNSGVSKTDDFQTCCNKLRQVFSTSSHSSALRQLFHRFQRPGESDEDYLYDLKSLALRARSDDIPVKHMEEWVVEQFVNGVHPRRLRQDLLLSRCRSSEELLRLTKLLRRYINSRPRQSNKLGNHRRPLSYLPLTYTNNPSKFPCGCFCNDSIFPLNLYN